MKKMLLSLSGILTIGMLLTACGEDPASPPEETTPTAASTETEDPVEDVVTEETEDPSENAEEQQGENDEESADNDTIVTPAADIFEPDLEWLSFSLEKIADVPIKEFVTSNYYYATENNKASIVNVDGRILNNETYFDIDLLSDDMLFVRKNDPDHYPNVGGLMLRDGTEILPCEASIIRKLNDRFVTVTYATEKVKEKKDAFFYITDDMISITPDSNDELYAGYMLIYDLAENAFIKNFKNENAASALYTLGDTIVYKENRFSDSCQLFNADGTEIEGSFLYDNDWTGENVLRVNSDNTYTVLDGNMNEISNLNYKPDTVYKSGKLFSYMDRDSLLYYLADAEKNNLVEKGFWCDPHQYGNIIYEFEHKDKGKKGSIYLTDGTKIIDGEVTLNSILEFDSGFLKIKSGNVTGLIYPNGTYIKDIGDVSFSSLIKDGADEAIIIRKGEITPLGNKLNTCGFAWFVTDTDTSSLKALYELVNGEQLLDYAYKSIEYKNGYVYAKTEDVYEVYKVHVSKLDEYQGK